MRTVLISGAGIAGATLAFWLSQHGFKPTVVERSQGLRSSGNPIDVRGPAVPVAQRMGVMPALRAAATSVSALSFVNAKGRQTGRVNMRAMQRAGGSEEVELPRADLARILVDAGSDSTEYLFDDTIVGLHQDADGVQVTFDRAAPRRFDLVIGADGLHSAVRRLVFGPESQFVRYAGLYVATLPLTDMVVNRHDVVLHNTAGRLASIHPSVHTPLAAFIFRHPAVPGFDYRDLAQHKLIVIDAFAGDGWRVPELLEQVRATDDLYFDAVSQVRLPTWSSGRIALLGDAASCVSLFGDGSTLAMAGAFTLAEELAKHDHETALRNYESRHRLLVEPKQRNLSQAAAILVPRTRAGVALRNVATRLWPLAAAGAFLKNRITG